MSSSMDISVLNPEDSWRFSHLIPKNKTFKNVSSRYSISPMSKKVTFTNVDDWAGTLSSHHSSRIKLLMKDCDEKNSRPYMHKLRHKIDDMKDEEDNFMFV